MLSSESSHMTLDIQEPSVHKMASMEVMQTGRQAWLEIYGSSGCLKPVMDFVKNFSLGTKLSPVPVDRVSQKLPFTRKKSFRCLSTRIQLKRWINKNQNRNLAEQLYVSLAANILNKHSLLFHLLSKEYSVSMQVKTEDTQWRSVILRSC